jgi:retron-type reverse transcriptase
MVRQNKEDCAVPEGLRKPAQTQGVESQGGGKAVPVNEQTWQLELQLETAENPVRTRTGAVVGRVSHQRETQPHAVPKSKGKEKKVTSATMEEVTSRLSEAFQNVAANKGAAGPDRQTIEEVKQHLGEILPRVSQALLEGTYVPGDIRRVWIPKGGGGERGLGIPNVVDRMVAEAVRMVLEPLYEPTFQPESHGFRPGRSCHTAFAEARKHIEEGYEWVVDLDVEKFFDRVNHQRLMARLAERIEDRRILVLIGKMLKAEL